MQVRRPDAEPGRAVFGPVGELDMASAGGLERALDDVLDEPGLIEIVVDLAEVPFIDSTGVAALLHCAAEAVGRGASLRIVDPRPVVARVLRITAVGTLLGLPDGDEGGTAPGGARWRR